MPYPRGPLHTGIKNCAIRYIYVVDFVVCYRMIYVAATAAKIRNVCDMNGTPLLSYDHGFLRPFSSKRKSRVHGFHKLVKQCRHLALDGDNGVVVGTSMRNE